VQCTTSETQNCASGDTCVSDTCQSSTGICTTAADCVGNANGTACVQGVCACNTASDCPSGDTCMNNACTSATSGGSGCPSGSSALLPGLGTLCAVLCPAFGGTCDSGGDCCSGGSSSSQCALNGPTGLDDGTCTTTSDCASQECTSDVCESGECNEEAVDSSQSPCSLSECEAGGCTGVWSGATCTCSSSSGMAGSTTPVACDGQ
jgi:hypothetical protein